MERELLIHLSWTTYISPDECVGSRSLSSKPLSWSPGLLFPCLYSRLLQRANLFWQRHESSAARRWKDDGAPDILALLGPNLFCVASSA
jgi:hypothetical protein